MHASEVFAYYAEGEKLCTGKDRDDGGQKWKPRHTAFHAITSEDVKKYGEPEQRAAKSNQAGELQGRRTEARHHVERVADQLCESVSLRA